MMEHEVSNPVLEMHRCTIEYVYPSGLIDARSERASFFERIPVGFSGVDGAFALGDQCIVLTDSAQSFAMVGMRPVTKNEAGEDSAHLFDDDLVDWNNARTIGMVDAYGNRARVITSPGAGVLIDAGDWCAAHYSPGLRKFLQYVERREIFMPGHYQRIEHDGDATQALYRWHTEVDDDAFDRVLANKKPEAKGHTLEIDVQKSDEGVVTIDLSEDGEDRWSLSISPDGGLTIDAAGDVTIRSEDVRLGDSEQAQFVALENLVKGELEKLKNKQDEIISKLLLHKHATNNGATSSPSVQISTNPDIGDVGAERVRAK